MAAKFLYFRKDSTVGNDDDVVNGSNMIAISDIISIEATGSTSAVLRMKPRMNAFSGGEAANADYITDSITLTIDTNALKDVILDLGRAIATSRSAVVVLYDAVTSETVSDSLSAVSPVIAAAQA
jgi:hypothetical protein